MRFSLTKATARLAECKIKEKPFFVPCGKLGLSTSKKSADESVDSDLALLCVSLKISNKERVS